MTAAGLAGDGSPAGSSEQAGSAAGSASIGSVLDALRPDFPEITISKIRFLESEGLISPARTASGYRQFSPADVARLRFVLSAQRDHYLPLKVIRTKLEEFDRDPRPEGPVLPSSPLAAASAAAPATPGTGFAAPGRTSGPGPAGPVRSAAPAATGPRPVPPGAAPTGPVVVDPPPVGADPGAFGDPGPPPADGPVGRETLLAEDGVDDALLDGLEHHGVLHADESGRYEPEAVAVARAAAALAALGVEPRLLRGLRAGADREVGLFAQLLTPVARHRGPDAARRADELGHELARLSGQLHALLVGAGLRRTLRR